MMQVNRQTKKAEEAMVDKHEPQKATVYLSKKEAAALMGVHERTVSRMIDRGELVARHARNKRVQILLEDVLTWREQQGLPRFPRPDRLEQLAQEVQTLKTQLHSLQEQVDYLLTPLAAMTTVRNRTEAVDSEQHQLSFDLNDLARLLASFRPAKSAQRSYSALDRRGLSPGTMTVAAFAQQHQVKVNRIKKLCEEDHSALTIIPRSNAMRNAREWWITPEQQHQLILFWQQQQVPYVACPQCPHNVSDKVLAE
jgi:excisionase family DNA binding protein